MAGIANLVDRLLSSFHVATLHYLGQVPRLPPTEQGLAYPQCFERILDHLSPYLNTGLFLFGRAEIDFPLPRLLAR